MADHAGQVEAASAVAIPERGIKPTCIACGRSEGDFRRRERDGVVLEMSEPCPPLARCEKCGAFSCPDCMAEGDCCAQVAKDKEAGQVKAPTDAATAAALDHLREIERLNEEYLAAIEERDEDAERAKGSRKRAEVLGEELAHFIKTGAAPMPLFDQPPAETPEDDIAWRAVGLESLTDPALTPGTVLKLRAAKIDTMGDLADYSAAHEGFMDIPGVGSETREKIQAAVDAYWKRNPRAQTQEPTPEDTTGGLDA